MTREELLALADELEGMDCRALVEKENRNE